MIPTPIHLNLEGRHTTKMRSNLDFEDIRQHIQQLYLGSFRLCEVAPGNHVLQHTSVPIKYASPQLFPTLQQTDTNRNPSTSPEEPIAGNQQQPPPFPRATKLHHPLCSRTPLFDSVIRACSHHHVGIALRVITPQKEECLSLRERTLKPPAKKTRILGICSRSLRGFHVCLA